MALAAIYLLLYVVAAIPLFISDPNPARAFGWSILYWIRLTINVGVPALIIGVITSFIWDKSIGFRTFHIVFIGLWIVLAVFMTGGPRILY